MEKRETKEAILEALKKAGIVEDKETGKVIIHLSCGGITKVTKPDKDFLK